ncbi:TldD/PmbA family protein [Oscillatoria sp. CS-180]|uniref:TldD/PmbA family protein n=1 Tax=Oscillatoria sp. CS-180 TaxID=3021720 RepID=UPI0023311968|nr:TldD/PmbA family protein [Oscillatoria sp. CS-180]MDB9528136.1 TldD/PmbA family protein [Oscillatoria sp. CS-180]
MQTWETTFNQLIDALIPQLNEDESLTLSLVAEESQFTRFNHAKVRQTGSVENGDLTLTLMGQQRSATESVTFTGEKATDWPLLLAALQTLREELPDLPEDSYLVLPEGDAQSREVYSGDLLASTAVAPTIMAKMAGIDAAGLYAGGRSVRAYADSAGQRHWFETATFTLDYSLFTASGQAVKGTYAGRTWDDTSYADTLGVSQTLLKQMAQTPRQLERGQYRTYLAPSAVADLVSMLSWGGISEAAIRRGGSALGALRRQEQTLSNQVHLTEDFSQGQVPRFNQYGELAPTTMPLIESGQLVNTLVSARTAKEYDIPSTYAAGGEYLRSPVLSPGTLATSDILSALDTGLYVSNLHYLNWSDRPNGRITGMTRYACFWVENGKIIAPIENLRFDESLYNFWGENLIALTQDLTFIPEVGSYGYRDLGGTLVPGMLVNNFAYTL